MNHPTPLHLAFRSSSINSLGHPTRLEPTWHTPPPVPSRISTSPPISKPNLLNSFNVPYSTPTLLGDVCKTDHIQQFVISNNLDCVVFTETWLQNNDTDAQKIGEVTPAGYYFHHKPRTNRRKKRGNGGRVGVLVKSGIKAKLEKTTSLATFEHLVVQLTIAKTQLRLFIIYRPPPSSVNKFTVSKFFDDFSVLMEQVATFPGHIIMLGDFSFHVDDPGNASAKRLLGILDSQGLTKHVNGPTHKACHTLDLAISKTNLPLFLTAI